MRREIKIVVYNENKEKTYISFKYDGDSMVPDMELMNFPEDLMTASLAVANALHRKYLEREEAEKSSG